ncbi:MAG: FG-GAP repeat protein, partial [Nitrospira sp.]|nr:FG-GAP repeat protein [Nitrospira sp.]
SQQAYVKASDTGDSDAFGTSVAISGDTLVVGAPGEDSNGVGVNPAAPAQTDNSALASGAVYVFARNAGVWSQQAYVKASNTGDSDLFGTSVSISGNQLVVGAPGEDGSLTTVVQGSPNNGTTTDGATGAGAVYAFINPGGGWSQQAYVKAPNAESGDTFGGSVAISGDTLVVGAIGEESTATGVGGNQDDNSLVNAGAVYVFR